MRKAFIFLILFMLFGGSILFISRKSDFGPALKLEVLKKEEIILPPEPLSNPPVFIKGIYATAWSAGSSKKIEELIGFIKDNELNAIVIDLKDFSGYLAYDSKLKEVEKYGAEQIKIEDLDNLIRKLHGEGIYVIARLTVFQDPVLAKAKPDLALKSKKTGETWYDHKKLAWIDAAAREAWEYNASIAKEVFSHGIDEVNFDYIRFASDGNLDDIQYPFWDEKVSMRKILKEFFTYLRRELKGRRISADLFGLTTVASRDLGIGQIIEDTFPYFDYIDPMIYPSHYASGFQGYENPAEHPYEVVRHSMDSALSRLYSYITDASSTPHEASISFEYKLRPWLQDFDIGSVYDEKKVLEEIRGTEEAFNFITSTVSSIMKATSTRINLDKLPRYSGWLMWASDNKYTKIKL